MLNSLNDWSTLNAILTSCSEQEAHELLQLELKERGRRSMLLRIYSRYNRMRALRERAELLAKAKP